MFCSFLSSVQPAAQRWVPCFTSTVSHQPTAFCIPFDSYYSLSLHFNWYYNTIFFSCKVKNQFLSSWLSVKKHPSLSARSIPIFQAVHRLSLKSHIQVVFSLSYMKVHMHCECLHCRYNCWHYIRRCNKTSPSSHGM